MSDQYPAEEPVTPGATTPPSDALAGEPPRADDTFDAAPADGPEAWAPPPTPSGAAIPSSAEPAVPGDQWTREPAVPGDQSAPEPAV